MATQSEIRRYLQPSLKQRPDLLLAGRWLFLFPTHHITRFVLLNGTGNPDRFAPLYGARPLFEPNDDVFLTYTAPIPHPETGFGWSVAESSKLFLDTLDRTVLPRLRAIQTIQSFVEFANHVEPSSSALSTPGILPACLHTSLGRFDEALAICEELQARFGHKVRPERSDPLDCLLLDLWPLLKAGDPSAIAEQLRAWERRKAEKLKIAKLWQATPFPFEEGA